MDIIEKIRDIDCYLKSVNASRPIVIPEDALKQLEIKRDVSHAIDLPNGKSDHFYVVVTDKIAFTPGEGPFEIEVVIGASIILAEPMLPREITKLVSVRKNILSILNQCLPHSSAIIAHLTDKMGFSPVIISSRIALNKKELNNAGRLSSRRAK